LSGPDLSGPDLGSPDVPARMHEGELEIGTALVAGLLRAQFPAWADLPLRRLSHSGTDNAVFRLGDDLLVRLPRIDWAAGDVLKEAQWLPRLAPQLPLPISVPLELGHPREGFPWHWAVYAWLEGEDASAAAVPDLNRLARDLAGFVRALQATPTWGQTPTGLLKTSRGGPLAGRGEDTLAAIQTCGDLGLIEVAQARRVWAQAVQAPVWTAAPVWIHADLKPGNLISRGGCLSAVIDFGGLTLGDPALDLMPAWNLLTAESRAAYRQALTPGNESWLPDAWTRGRGWALSTSVIALPYYRHTNPGLADICRATIAAVLADVPGDREATGLS
jgi:aminoglycoside phosphotransferase (APT) family kinase protein